MIGFVPKPITLNYSSVPLENISEFDKNAEYILGATRKYGNNIYVALADIPRTVNHIFNDTDELNIYGFDLYTNKNIPNINNVPIVSGKTIVYVMSSKKYYNAKYTGNVNYLTSITNITYFEDLGINPTPLYRIKLDYPNGKKDTLFWGYHGVLNRYVMLDEIINKQTLNDRSFATNKQVIFSTNVCLLSEPLSDNINLGDKLKIVGTQHNNGYYKISSISENRLSFTIETNFISETVASSIVTFFAQTYIVFESLGIDRIAFFNIVAEKIEIKIFNGAVTNIEEIAMLDSKWINTFELFSFNEPTRLYSTVKEILPSYTQHFEITFYGDYQKIGEVMIGTASDLGEVEDSVSIDGKIYANLEETTNGDIYVEQNLTQKEILDRKQFTMVVDSNRVEYYKNNIKALLGKPIVISGSKISNDNNPSLLTYGFIRDYSFKARFKEERSTYTFEIREFKEWQS